MKIYLICDNTDTKVGMKLAGIEGVIVHGKDEFVNALNDAIADETNGIILINENLCKYDTELINNIKMKYSKPLIIEIPDRHGTGRKADFITSYVKDAIGINLGE